MELTLAKRRCRASKILSRDSSSLILCLKEKGRSESSRFLGHSFLKQLQKLRIAMMNMMMMTWTMVLLVWLWLKPPRLEVREPRNNRFSRLACTATAATSAQTVREPRTRSESVLQMVLKLTRASLTAEMEKYGETVPAGWTMTELSHRVSQLHEEHQVKTGKHKTELREMVVRLNRAGTRKASLQQFCQQELGLPITGNETMKQMQNQAMVKIYQTTTPSESDPVGFGKGAALTYAEIKQDAQYCEWMIQTVEEGDACPQMVRLVKWLQESKEGKNAKSVKMETNILEPDPQLKIPKSAASRKKSSAASSSNSQMTHMLQELTQVVTALKEEVSDMKQERPRKETKS